MVNGGGTCLAHAVFCVILLVLGRFPRFKNPVKYIRGAGINGKNGAFKYIRNTGINRKNGALRCPGSVKQNFRLYG